MKATLFSEHGGPEVLRYEEVADPEPGPGEALVKVCAVSVNYGPDTMVRSGTFRIPVALPHVSGSDPAGDVAAVGAGVDESIVGRRVAVVSMIACGSCDFCAAGRGENYCRSWQLLGVHRWGGRAEYVVVPARNLVELPDTVSYEQGAAMGVAYITAYHGMVRKARTHAGDTVLVTGAGGGMGVACIQLAKAIGARVIATSTSPRKLERAREIGADVVLDASSEDWPEHVLEATDGRGASVLFDNVGPVSWSKSVGLLDRGGRFFCSGGTTGPALSLDVMPLYRNQITMYFYANGSISDLRELVRLAGEGRIDPVIDTRFPLSEAATAEARVEARKQFGNVVLVPDSVMSERQLVSVAGGSAGATTKEA